MTSKLAALLVKEEVETSYLPAWIRSSYDVSIVILEYRRMTYGGDCGSSDDMDLSSDWFVNGKSAYFMIADTGSGISLMVHLSSPLLCLIGTRVPGWKG